MNPESPFFLLIIVEEGQKIYATHHPNMESVERELDCYRRGGVKTRQQGLNDLRYECGLHLYPVGTYFLMEPIQHYCCPACERQYDNPGKARSCYHQHAPLEQLASTAE